MIYSRWSSWVFPSDEQNSSSNKVAIECALQRCFSFKVYSTAAGTYQQTPDEKDDIYGIYMLYSDSIHIRFHGVSWGFMGISLNMMDVSQNSWAFAGSPGPVGEPPWPGEQLTGLKIGRALFLLTVGACFQSMG